MDAKEVPMPMRKEFVALDICVSDTCYKVVSCGLYVVDALDNER